MTADHTHEWQVEYLPDPMSAGSVVRSGGLFCACGATKSDVPCRCVQRMDTNGCLKHGEKTTADHTPERLNAEERATLEKAIRDAGPIYDSDGIYTTVERILAAHLADVEARLAAAWKALDEPGWYASQRVSRARAALRPTPDDPA